jgi:ribonuclease HI
MSPLRIYTDGGCSGNPGPGAWAYIILDDGRQTGARPAQASSFVSNTTNNRMELQAVIEALRAVTGNSSWRCTSVELFTDSQYVKNGITQWIHTWVRNGWKTKAKKPVKNQDLWQELVSLSKPLTVSWHWLQGHAGDEHNEACDKLVRQTIKQGRK